MNVARIYLETTIFSRYFDVDRKYYEETKLLFDAIKSNRFIPFTSSYVIEELEIAQEPKRSMMLQLIMTHDIYAFEANQEIEKLAARYIELDIVPAKYITDAAHIASASVHGLDFIISLNFLHINKLQTKTLVEKINRSLQYVTPVICTPIEVLYE